MCCMPNQPRCDSGEMRTGIDRIPAPILLDTWAADRRVAELLRCYEAHPYVMCWLGLANKSAHARSAASARSPTMVVFPFLEKKIPHTFPFLENYSL